MRQPAHIEDLECQSRADKLIRFALDAELQLFHDPDQKGHNKFGIVVVLASRHVIERGYQIGRSTEMSVAKTFTKASVKGRYGTPAR
jgi:hypothetical protein